MSSPSSTTTFLNQVTNAATSAISYVRLPVLASSGIAAILSVLLYFKQNLLENLSAEYRRFSEVIYQRNLPIGARTEVPKPPIFSMTDWEDLSIPTPDGESLHAYFLRPTNRRFEQNVTVLMFHGNAGNIGHRLPIGKVLQEHMGCHVLLLEYRGYGLSTGSPNERGILIDAQTGFDYLTKRAETRNTKIVVYGQSLGGAVGIQLVAKNEKRGNVGGLVLENTFMSMRKLIPSALPPAKYLARLCHQIWPSDTTLPMIKDTPILFLSGLKDEIVPASHMEQLFGICRSRKQTFKELPNGTHNDTMMEPGYFEAMFKFIREDVLKNR
ncbi:hypothetical protein FGG08_005230 [Glutinoglossum americanum]|uniref:AB hydrolase-1 domain-containing protein n=1 Tax=Glutinoglossum americanum TaxID=1670608 RepID=A0A9P8L209_9PEZI|nr:hypothetical protein FGG08_005230 [Glutinoglossum americanum]